MNEFAEKFASRFAGRAGDPFRADELMCVANEALGIGDEAIYVPADSHEAAVSNAAAITASMRQNGTFWVLTANVPGRFFDGLSRTRKAYYDDVRALHKLWIDEGQQITKVVADRFIIAREIVKDFSRAESPVPLWVYKVRDADVKNAHGSKPHQLLALGRYKQAIEGSFRPNEGVKNFALRIAGPVAKTLRVDGYVVVAVDLSYSAMHVYNATSSEEQQAALEETGKSIGAGVGLAAGALLCSVMTVGTGGVALFVGCAAVTVATTRLFETGGGWLLGGALASDIATKVRAR